jgi:uncharacterized heparinase superfamily protein
MKVRGLLLYLRTIRYLKPVQFYGRLWFRLYQPKPDLRAASAMRAHSNVWVACQRAPSMTDPTHFRFLSTVRAMTMAGDWNRADWPKLWLYNLHYFDDLAADRAFERTDWHRSLITRWVAENPPSQGNGWEPYPTSLRSVNWVKWALAGNALPPEALHSLAVQARWLRKRLEVHLLGNHLWANAKALVFVGALFEGDEAASWLDKGLRLLRRELAEQLLLDGGHFERSPMYHAILLEDVLDLLQVAQRYPGLFNLADIIAWRRAASQMGRWLQLMTHPDGGIAFFNDAALGIAPTFSALQNFAMALDVALVDKALARLEVLAETGYVRLQAGPAVLLADVGQIGPDYLPGHAHADTLSFELSLLGRRVLVNGGTSTYMAGAERVRQRGTAAHNTVAVDGQDSSEVWSSFRVARRARPLSVRWGQEEEMLWLEAAHDGYQRLPGRVTHRRRWVLTENSLEIIDTLEGQWHSAVACFQLHPDFEVCPLSDGLTLSDGKGLSLRFAASKGTPEVTQSTWHPRFGESMATTTIQLSLSGPQTHVSITWC